MNKKLLVFGFMGLFMVALVAAAVVDYYSNEVTQDIVIESPLELIGGNFDIESVGNFTATTSGFTLTNNAGGSIHTIVEKSNTGDSVVITTRTNFGEEFEALDIGIVIPGVISNALCINVTGDYFDDGYCYWKADYDRSFTGVIDGVYYVQMGDGNVPIEAGETMEGRMKLQFSTDISPATYTFATQALTVDDAKNLTNA